LKLYNNDGGVKSVTNVAPEDPAKLGPDAEFHRRLTAGEFCLQKCRSCGSHIFFPRAICPECGADELDWVAATGAGTVYSTSVIRQKPERGGDYNYAIIDLAEGPRMVSRVENIPPEEVAIDMKVTARIITDEDRPYIVFDPADGEG
tara:strand:+ start:1503 stop:1943 length:441 start_codon:yes stop_codon:yes gene_type:complete